MLTICGLWMQICVVAGVWEVFLMQESILRALESYLWTTLLECYEADLMASMESPFLCEPQCISPVKWSDCARHIYDGQSSSCRGSELGSFFTCLGGLFAAEQRQAHLRTKSRYWLGSWELSWVSSGVAELRFHKLSLYLTISHPISDSFIKGKFGPGK